MKQVGQGPQSSTAYFVGILEIKYLPKEEGNLGKNSLLIFFYTELGRVDGCGHIFLRSELPPTAGMSEVDICVFLEPWPLDPLPVPLEARTL